GLLQEGQVLVEKLFLECDRARGDDGFLTAFQDGDQVAERFSAARAGLDDRVTPLAQGVRDERGHLYLLGAVLVTGKLAHHLPHQVLDHRLSGRGAQLFARMSLPEHRGVVKKQEGSAALGLEEGFRPQGWKWPRGEEG